MRTKTKRKIKIEVAENTIPMEEALNRLAKVIARQMYEESHRKEARK